MKASMTDIYVELLNEGTFVLRPTKGEAISEDVYRVMATSDYCPDLENWRFLPGTLVKCAWEEHGGELVLVAKGLAT